MTEAISLEGQSQLRGLRSIQHTVLWHQPAWSRIGDGKVLEVNMTMTANTYDQHGVIITPGDLTMHTRIFGGDNLTLESEQEFDRGRKRAPVGTYQQREQFHLHIEQVTDNLVVLQVIHDLMSHPDNGPSVSLWQAIWATTLELVDSEVVAHGPDYVYPSQTEYFDSFYTFDPTHGPVVIDSAYGQVYKMNVATGGPARGKQVRSLWTGTAYPYNSQTMNMPIGVFPADIQTEDGWVTRIYDMALPGDAIRSVSDMGGPGGRPLDPDHFAGSYSTAATEQDPWTPHDVVTFSGPEGQGEVNIGEYVGTSGFRLASTLRHPTEFAVVCMRAESSMVAKVGVLELRDGQLQITQPFTDVASARYETITAS